MGPVCINPPNFLKKLNESLFFKKFSNCPRLMVETIAPANLVLPSIPSVPIDDITHGKSLNSFDNCKTNS